MTFTEQGKERFALQRWITFQLRDHPGPILLKWVDAGLPVVRSFEITGQLSDLLILASRAFAHASTSGSHSLGSTFASFLHRELDLGIFLHMTPFRVLCDRCHARSSTGHVSSLMTCWLSSHPLRGGACFLLVCLDSLSRCCVRTLLTGHKGGHVMVELVQRVLSFRVQGQGDRSTVSLRPASPFDRQQPHRWPHAQWSQTHCASGQRATMAPGAWEAGQPFALVGR